MTIRKERVLKLKTIHGKDLMVYSPNENMVYLLIISGDSILKEKTYNMAETTAANKIIHKLINKEYHRWLKILYDNKEITPDDSDILSA